MLFYVIIMMLIVIVSSIVVGLHLSHRQNNRRLSRGEQMTAAKVAGAFPHRKES